MTVHRVWNLRRNKILIHANLGNTKPIMVDMVRARCTQRAERNTECPYPSLTPSLPKQKQQLDQKTGASWPSEANWNQMKGEQKGNEKSLPNAQQGSNFQSLWTFPGSLYSAVHALCISWGCKWTQKKWKCYIIRSEVWCRQAVERLRIKSLQPCRILPFTTLIRGVQTASQRC